MKILLNFSNRNIFWSFPPNNRCPFCLHISKRNQLFQQKYLLLQEKNSKSNNWQKLVKYISRVLHTNLYWVKSPQFQDCHCLQQSAEATSLLHQNYLWLTGLQLIVSPPASPFTRKNNVKEKKATTCTNAKETYNEDNMKQLIAIILALGRKRSQKTK